MKYLLVNIKTKKLCLLTQFSATVLGSVASAGKRDRRESSLFSVDFCPGCFLNTGLSSGAAHLSFRAAAKESHAHLMHSGLAHQICS